MNNFFEINSKLKQLTQAIELECVDQFKEIEQIEQHNTNKVLHAFLKNKVSSAHFIETTGYGYDDIGRTIIDNIFSQVFNTEDALVRCNFMSGTHTISVALFAILKPNDTILSITGTPYDTVQTIFGLNCKNKSTKNLQNCGINIKIIDLLPNAQFNFKLIKDQISKNTIKLIYIQRSRGYETRPSIKSNDIEQLVNFTKTLKNRPLVFVDNCYGEFVEKNEPTSVGADLICGSLIKNPGGGIATTGGYIAGKAELIKQCAIELSAPGLGKKVGCNFNQNRNILMGLFLAPHVVSNALKTSVFVRKLFLNLNFKVFPTVNTLPADIVSTITLENPTCLLEFCKNIQANSPINSFLTPTPWLQPGLNSEIVMAAGNFTEGSSIELSADAPLKKPYNIFVQGGLTFFSAKTCLLNSVQKLIDKKLINL